MGNKVPIIPLYVILLTLFWQRLGFRGMYILVYTYTG